MNDAMKLVCYAFMDLRNVVRLFSRNKNKSIIIRQINLAIFSLQKLKLEAEK